MIQLLRCPKISIENLGEYFSHSNDQQKYSNFGYCENLLRSRLAKSLSVPVESTCLGSSATSLLMISCDMLLQKIEKPRSVYFPVFSFFSTFSIATKLQQQVSWFDVELESFLPRNIDGLDESDLLFVNVPFGSSKIEPFLEFARNLPCYVIIDAAACLPGLIYNNKNLSSIPPNVIIVFSLHATKLLNCGEGGFCIFGGDVPNHIKQLTNFGIDENRKQKWTHSYNAKMSEYNAAAGLCSLDDFKQNAELIVNAKKTVAIVCEKYDISTFVDATEPTLTFNTKVSNVRAIMDHLALKGYESRQWWSLSKTTEVSAHEHSITLYRQLLGIPFDWQRTECYIDDLCQAIHSVTKKIKRLRNEECQSSNLDRKKSLRQFWS